MKRTDSDRTEFDWQVDAVERGDLTPTDRLREIYEARIRTPAAVAWADVRTRLGLLVVAFYLFMALVAVLGLWRRPSSNQAPTSLTIFEDPTYPLGTTASGVDLAALVIHSTPEILLMISAGALWATVLGVVVGTVAGYKGGRVDTVLMAASDFVMAIPGLPLVIILALTFDPGNPVFVGVIITINYWAGLGRSIRSQVLTVREDEYVEAARTMGVGTPRILYEDVLPNIMPYVTVNAVFAARYTIFAAIGLYFIGVLPYSTQNWGVTLQYAYDSGALFSWSLAHWIFAPMAAIMGLTFGFMLLGQGMDRIFNPRVRTRLQGESESTEGEDAGADDDGTVTAF